MLRFFFLMLMFLPANAWAGSPGTVDVFFSALKLFAGTAIVIGLMLLLHFFSKRGAKFLEGRHAGNIRILETRAVGGKKALCLVEVRGETILLGLGNDRIDLLHCFAPEDADPGQIDGGKQEKPFDEALRECREESR